MLTASKNAAAHFSGPSTTVVYYQGHCYTAPRHYLVSQSNESLQQIATDTVVIEKNGYLTKPARLKSFSGFIYIPLGKTSFWRYDGPCWKSEKMIRIESGRVVSSTIVQNKNTLPTETMYAAASLPGFRKALHQYLDSKQMTLLNGQCSYFYNDTAKKIEIDCLENDAILKERLVSFLDRYKKQLVIYVHGVQQKLYWPL